MRTRSYFALLALIVTTMFGSLLIAAPASAHEERAASFPDGTGTVPTYKGLYNDHYRVVCTSKSSALIANMPSGALKTRNKQLLNKCNYSSIQDAINSIKVPKTSIYILPGTYLESKYANSKPEGYCASIKKISTNPLGDQLTQYIGSLVGEQPAAEYGDGPIALSYADQVKCPHNLNLIAIMGDKTPDDTSIKCNNQFCGTQLVGTGRSMKDVVIDNKFSKLNAIRTDRVNGIVFRNFTVQQAEFNAVYVLETDGFLVDKVVARGNDEYGILAFASDHGLIQNVDAYYNGDSGIYPGSASDLNADSKTIAVKRYAIEIRNNKSHHNALGYSGTAGNSVYAHHNKFYENATGIATDSLFPGHPGLPQDHARWAYNDIFSNNQNYFKKYVHTGICAKPMKERGYINGTVCPVIPTPVGTGVLIAGGNFNLTDNNRIYNNWRYGTMQFWVPAPLRDEFDPSKLFDTSHGNQVKNNTMGIKADGTIAHNGMDHWWDDQGTGNCWENNKSSRGKATHNFVINPGSCAGGGSKLLPGLIVKDAGFLTCSQYNRADPQWRNPPLCSWFKDPAQPTDARTEGPLVGVLSSTGGSSPGAAILVGLGLAAVGMQRIAQRRRARS
ncbi:right-handed parallel beta-helix repeat-containing protein [Aeromicrobium sp.]|uniref:right-handed parallel beta-helix repeat-containing protein n=1 Tax=Aeromicrobium sp. TaxID=1871063 RepID=UPI002FCB4E4B